MQFGVATGNWKLSAKSPIKEHLIKAQTKRFPSEYPFRIFRAFRGSN
ncbi:hypothetical protein CA11_21650 [Gimesia maris]|nr:hypothetical protein CA11_21650 [Gimesia maris]